MVKASGRKKRRFLPEKAEGKQLEATNSESGKMHHRTPWLTADPHEYGSADRGTSGTYIYIYIIFFFVY